MARGILGLATEVIGNVFENVDSNMYLPSHEAISAGNEAGFVSENAVIGPACRCRGRRQTGVTGVSRL